MDSSYISLLSMCFKAFKSLKIILSFAYLQILCSSFVTECCKNCHCLSLDVGSIITRNFFQSIGAGDNILCKFSICLLKEKMLYI